MGTPAVGDPLDERRPEVVAGALGRPARHRVGGQEVVAVHAQRGDARTHAARGEGGALAAGDGLEGGDGPLVVDHVQDHRRAIHVSEGEGVVEIGLGSGAVADPARGDPGVALDRRGHGPAHRLDELGGQVARQAEEAGLLQRVQHRQLAALERVALVGQQLVDQLHQRDVTCHEQALLAVGGKAHVALAQGEGVRHADRFLAEALHVERDLLLALRDHHARVEQARPDHRAQAGAQPLRLEIGRPGTERAAFVVEHAHQAGSELGGLGRARLDGRTRRRAGRSQAQVGEIGGVARPAGRLRDVQAQRLVGVHLGIARQSVSGSQHSEFGRHTPRKACSHCGRSQCGQAAGGGIGEPVLADLADGGAPPTAPAPACCAAPPCRARRARRSRRAGPRRSCRRRNRSTAGARSRTRSRSRPATWHGSR